MVDVLEADALADIELDIKNICERLDEIEKIDAIRLEDIENDLIELKRVILKADEYDETLMSYLVYWAKP